MNLAALRSRERNLRRGLGALGGLAFLVVGVPAVLLGLSRALLDTPNPLGGMTAPWTWSGTEIKDALTRALDNQTVISTISRVGLTLAWIALVERVDPQAVRDALDTALPHGLDKTILRCLEMDPGDRYPFLSVVVRDLEQALYV